MNFFFFSWIYAFSWLIFLTQSHLWSILPIHLHWSEIYLISLAQEYWTLLWEGYLDVQCFILVFRTCVFSYVFWFLLSWLTNLISNVFYFVLVLNFPDKQDSIWIWLLVWYCIRLLSYFSKCIPFDLRCYTYF